jgi:hypothetical protein
LDDAVIIIIIIILITACGLGGSVTLERMVKGPNRDKSSEPLVNLTLRVLRLKEPDQNACRRCSERHFPVNGLDVDVVPGSLLIFGIIALVHLSHTTHLRPQVAARTAESVGKRGKADKRTHTS